MKQILLICCAVLCLLMVGCAQADVGAVQSQAAGLREDGAYTTAQEVCNYLDAYGQLPPNFITKEEAKELGWNSKAGNLREIAPDKSIGGDHYGDYEKQLPHKKGRKYFECDIEYEGGHRNAKRLIYSSDGLYFYTEDHYESFTQLEPEGAA